MSEKTANSSGVEIMLVDSDLVAEVVAYNADGEVIQTPSRLVVKPFFNRPAASVPLGFCRVLTDVDDPQSDVFKAVLRVLGSNGKLALVASSPSSVPKFATK